MPVTIEITQDDIAYAKSILLKERETFDEQRITFITNFETIDLQAVPGSGKTTALLAKLLILEKKLPLPNNRGILILSHTNAAVDEIKERIGEHCPKLFSYPNFIGTIQSFIDKFLAIPFYSNKFKRKPYRIDNEIYDERVENYRLPFGVNVWLSRRSNALEFKKSIRFNINFLLINNIDGETASFPLVNKDSDTYKAFKNMKSSLLKQGFLHFDDAYLLASYAIKTLPKIKLLLQQRFQLVFVDEMQDMEKHQYQILEELFFDNGSSKSIYQRIGDINQSIFSGKTNIDNIWIFRGVPLVITGSQRLNSQVAELVNCFALNREGDFVVQGLKIGTLKPCLIVYTLKNINQVLPRFSTKIRECVENGTIEHTEKNKYKAIGWTKEKDDNNKIAILDYYSEFTSFDSSKKIDYPSLDCYLKLFDTKKKTLEAVRKSLLNAFIKILRDENIVEPLSNRPFTKKQLLEFLEKEKPVFAKEFKVKIYQWSIALIKYKFDDVYKEVKQYIPSLLGIWGNAITNSKGFINNVEQNVSAYDINTQNSNNNRINIDGFDIELTTIHSAKGQTHTATLYLETFYEKGGDGYESGRFSNQFKYNLFDKNVDKSSIIQQAVKMAYVGLSRPTHLLCVAVQKERFDKYLSDIDRNKWDIIEL